MDDGSFNSSRQTYTLNTQGFTLSEQKILIKALKHNFNLDFNVQSDRIYYRLYLQAHCNKTFDQLIKPYVILFFDYKLNQIKGSSK